MLSKISIDQAEATRIALACIEEASAHGATVSVAVVDDAGNLLHFTRMDGARPHTIDLAIRKARAAASSAVSTKNIEAAVKAGLISNVEPVGWGGMPATIDGNCVGAVGVSGAAVDIDEAIARKGSLTLLP